MYGENPVDDYRPLLEETGFRILAYELTPSWHECLTAAYSALIQAAPALKEEMGSVASAAMLSEMTLTLERDIYSGRIFAIAECQDAD